MKNNPLLNLLKTNQFQQCSDEELLLYMQKGKDKAFNEIYKRYAKKMHYYFYRLLYCDNEKANDFVQDLFLKIIEKPDSFNLNYKFSTWLYTLASNMCKNEYRRNEVRGKSYNISNIELPSEELNSILSDNYDRNLFKKILNETLEKIDPDLKLIFTLKYQEYLSNKEISEIMNCPEGTVKSRLFYMLKKIGISMNIFTTTQ